MIIICKPHSTTEQLQPLYEHLINHQVHTIKGGLHQLLCLTGEYDESLAQQLQALPCVERVVSVETPYQLASRLTKPEPTLITVNDLVIGGSQVVVFAGPCACESLAQVEETAKAVKAAGAHGFRGGAFKPRTSPYTFQGHKTEALSWLQHINHQYQLPIISEITSLDELSHFEQAVDIIQVGARNMQNFELLKGLAKSTKPILLKRGFGNTIEEWLMSAEYLLAGGNPNVILCERGIRTFEPATRNTLDLSAVVLVKQLTHLPVIVDPSHGTGHWSLVEAMALAAIACGADGLLIEVHPHPDTALSDGGQSLTPENFQQLMTKATRVAQAIERTL